MRAAMMLLVSVVLLARPARADWIRPDSSEVAWQAAALVVTAADTLTTLNLRHRQSAGVTLVEDNPLLGKHPSDARILLLGGASVVGQVGVWAALPPPWRKVFSIVVLSVESVVLVKNISFGLVF